MIHYINIILIIIVSILLHNTLFKEGFDSISKIPMPQYTPIPHVPEDIIAYILDKIGAPKNPHHKDYTLEEEDCEI